MDAGSTGYIIVKVSTARGAIPLAGASVTISDKSGGVLYSLLTDRSGLTEKAALPAPAKELSLSPGGSSPPYASYLINVYKEGFFRNEFINAPVFADTTTVQNALLIPLPEYVTNPSDDLISFYQSENSDL